MDAAELLQQYVAGRRRFDGVCMIGADLTGACLPGISLVGANLTAAQF